MTALEKIAAAGWVAAWATEWRWQVAVSREIAEAERMRTRAESPYLIKLMAVAAFERRMGAEGVRFAAARAHEALR